MRRCTGTTGLDRPDAAKRKTKSQVAVRVASEATLGAQTAVIGKRREKRPTGMAPLEGCPL